MKFPSLLLALCAWPLLAGAAKEISSYDIKARFDASKKTIEGSEVLTWWNDSPDTVATLQFHLYMNAFKNKESTFMHESGGQLRGDKANGKEFGAIDIRRLQTGGADLTKAIRFIHPDDDNAADQSVIEVTLPQPVKPGDKIQVTIDFVTTLPHVFARTGFHGDFVLAGQWYPKIGVWETAGFRYSTKGSWNCHQFHANSEFFSNFGRYHVELTVPQDYVVGATGEMISKRDDVAAKAATYVFEQADVTDFAWTAQPTYLRVERTFVADKALSPADIAEAAKLHGIPESEVRLSDVKMILLAQPEHRGQMERYLNSLENGIKHFGLWYGHYPYKTLTLVDPPHGGGGAGGMEYPTLITGGTGFVNPDDFYGLEEVTIHEFGHQFWMELVATNEFEESWLDEGFNTYSTTRIMSKVYGSNRLPFTLFGVSLSRFLGMPALPFDSFNRAAYLFNPVSDNLVRNAWQYYDSTSYGINSYMKTGVALQMLERMLGGDTMARVMRTYHQRYRFHHPTSKQFQQVAEEVSGRDLGFFFDQFVFGNKLLDYSVASVSSKRVGTPAGLFDTPKGRVSVTVDQAEDKDEALDKDKKYKPQYESVVKVKREGDAVLPVHLRIKFKDGSVETRDWDGVYRWAKFTFVRTSEPAEVTIDPEHKLPLDVNLANNSWRDKPDDPLVARWTALALFYLGNVMLTIGGLV